MLSAEAQMIHALLKRETAMDGADIEERTGLDETSIKAAAVELRDARLITTSGAPNANEGGMAIDRLTITRLGRG